MDFSELRAAALDSNLVEGLTHELYRHPARFAPTFAKAAITTLSKPGDLVLDPYMGGGTTVVEAMAAGRRVIGSDVNSLAVFITQVKTTPLSKGDREAVRKWARKTSKKMTSRYSRSKIEYLFDDRRTINLDLPRARYIKKAVAIGIDRLDELPSRKAGAFARCLILKTAQWALDNRKRPTPLSEFRERFIDNAELMTKAIEELGKVFRDRDILLSNRKLLEVKAEDLISAAPFEKKHRIVDLVVTSPPYPGIHMLYHRWQVNGRRESPAPYWIADCQDGEAPSFYTFGPRENPDCYFQNLHDSLVGIRKLMKTGAHIVQMVAFSEARKQQKRFLATMEATGFEEVNSTGKRRSRIWRSVPNRKWHANFIGKTGASREVVLIHQAV